MLPQADPLPCDTAPMEQYTPAFIGLGANVGQARSSLARAVSALGDLPGASLAGVSRLYRTRPVGTVAQDDFLNAVVCLRVPAGASPASGASVLLLQLKGLERALGRVERERWGPREIDLDLLLFGDQAVEVERPPAARSLDPTKVGGGWLTVPHPEASRRLFVLAPLADLEPDLRPPGWGRTVAEARAAAEEVAGPEAVVVVGEWDPQQRCWRSSDDPDLAPGRGEETA